MLGAEEDERRDVARRQGQQARERGGRHQLEGLAGVQPLIARVVEPGVADLHQDPGQEESVAEEHHQGNDDGLGDEASSQRQLGAAGGTCDQLVQDIKCAAAPDQGRPAGDARIDRRAGRGPPPVPAAQGRNDRRQHAGGRPEDQVNGEDEQRHVVGQPRHVAERRQAGEDPVLQGQLEPGARLGQKDELGLAPVRLVGQEAHGLASRPGEDGEGDRRGDDPPGAPDPPARPPDQADVPVEVENLLEGQDRALEEQRHDQQRGQPGEEGPEPVEAGDGLGRGERQARAPAAECQVGQRRGIRRPGAGPRPARRPAGPSPTACAQSNGIINPCIRPPFLLPRESAPDRPTATSAAPRHTSPRARGSRPTFDDCT